MNYKFPQFNFRILTKKRGDTGAMKTAMELCVRCGVERGTDSLYPVIVDHTHQFHLIGPLLGELARGTTAYFHCKVKGTSQVGRLEIKH